MKFEEVMHCLEEHSPLYYAEEWDNVGLLAGRRDKEVQTIVLAVDATDDVVRQAVEAKADMLLTHHPLIFRAVKRVNTDDFIGRRIVTLIRNDISYVAMHTNFDVRGMADAAAEKLHLKHCEVLDVTCEEDGVAQGIGRIGQPEHPVSCRDMAGLVKEAFDLSAVRLFGDPLREIRRVAICPGSGKSVLTTSIEQKADVLVTGDIDHHEGIDAVAQGLTIIDAGHYGIEKLFVAYMESYLKKALPELTVIAASEQDPFITL